MYVYVCMYACTYECRYLCKTPRHDTRTHMYVFITCRARTRVCVTYASLSDSPLRRLGSQCLRCSGAHARLLAAQPLPLAPAGGRGGPCRASAHAHTHTRAHTHGHPRSVHINTHALHACAHACTHAPTHPPTRHARAGACARTRASSRARSSSRARTGRAHADSVRGTH